MQTAIADHYDVLIVGAGISGAIIAKELGLSKANVLILEAGEGSVTSIDSFMERFYNSSAKVPESPYTPNIFREAPERGLVDPGEQNVGRPTVLSLNEADWQNPSSSYFIQRGPLPFCSTYERLAGGTVRHWLGTSLRFLPNDFKMQSKYGSLIDWPINYSELQPWYGIAEAEIGVSADKKDQSYHGISFENSYEYPMPSIPASLVDESIRIAISNDDVLGHSLHVTPTPAGRNSAPYDHRPVCSGNTNCIPICPTGAKYDPSVTLKKALDTGYVQMAPKTVATEVSVNTGGKVTGVRYVRYEELTGAITKTGFVSAKIYILAAHAVETPRLLLMSRNEGRTATGVANRSDQVGRNLMDHPIYLAWALSPYMRPVYGYRGPLSTSGIEDLRDGKFRADRAAFRIEIGNEGWNFAKGDPTTTTLDFIRGSNFGGLNQNKEILHGEQLVQRLNNLLTRQFRLGFLIEQSPEQSNRVVLSTSHKDRLGLPRPEIHYNLSDYTKAGFVAARKLATEIFDRMGAIEYTEMDEQVKAQDPAAFDVLSNGTSQRFKFFGAGHTVGTYRMGDDPKSSVVDSNLRSWDHSNLFLVGSGTFPTVATGNPTLTVAALAFRLATFIKKELQIAE